MTLLLILGQGCKSSFDIKSATDNRSSNNPLCLVTADCLSDSTPVDSGSEEQDSGEPTLNHVLPDGWLVQGSVNIDIDCSGADQYGFSIVAGASEPDEWIDCPSDSFQATVNLAIGDNNVIVWLNGEEITSSESFYFYKGNQFAVTDPNPENSGGFGSGGIALLSNGNFVVRKKTDSKNAASSGAVHLFRGSDGTLISSFYGDQANDELGTWVTTLANGNFVIFNQYDDTATLVDAGLVILVDGETGAELARFQGDQASDRLSMDHLVTLDNSNFFIRSQWDNSPTNTRVGSVIHVNGTTGAEIWRLTGTATNHYFGDRTLLPLSNGNVVICHSLYATGGAATLHNGTTGAEISRLTGDHINDGFCSGKAEELPNGHYVIISQTLDTVVNDDRGAVILVNGETGVEIGRVTGDQDDNYIGKEGIVILSDGNYLIKSSWDDTAALTNTGSVILASGTTGTEIWKFEGDHASDQIGSNQSVELDSGNILVLSRFDDSPTLTDVGSAVLLNRATGAVIGRVEGNQNSDYIGNGGAWELANGNYVLINNLDNTASTTLSGSVILVNGTTGLEIGRIEGDHTNDEFGTGGFAELANGNYVVGSWKDNTATLTSAGSVTLVNGTTGTAISKVLGNASGDMFGLGLGFTPVELPGTNRFMAPHGYGDYSSLINNGAVTIYDSSSGAQLARTEGDQANDSFGIFSMVIDGKIVIASSADDDGATADAGSVFILDSSGSVLNEVRGSHASAGLGTGIMELTDYDYLLVTEAGADTDAKTGSGQIRLIPLN